MAGLVRWQRSRTGTEAARVALAVPVRTPRFPCSDSHKRELPPPHEQKEPSLERHATGPSRFRAPKHAAMPCIGRENLLPGIRL
jgi:hypothetical protein